MHVAITGASSGIGKALAQQWARRRARLTLVARRGELLRSLADAIGGAHTVPWDLSDPTRSAGWIADAEAANGPIDVLINNAGAESHGPFVHSSLDDGARVLRLNLETPIVLTRHVLPGMIARRSGAIVQILSVAALSAPRGQAWYGASKAGLHMFGEALRAELRGTGVNLLNVYPGPVKTPMGDSGYDAYGGRDRVPRAPEGTPEELARRTVRAVERRRTLLIYPRFYYLSWWFPRLARWANDRFTPAPLTPEERLHRSSGA